MKKIRMSITITRPVKERLDKEKNMSAFIEDLCLKEWGLRVIKSEERLESKSVETANEFLQD